mmetsp:Transcript_2008/g.4894  ORF Transcript_2008/g.4894 Transcript_2008/m.4894 type:complete len:250 (+) Transcript_2008:2589-3338(+)
MPKQRCRGHPHRAIQCTPSYRSKAVRLLPRQMHPLRRQPKQRAEERVHLHRHRKALELVRQPLVQRQIAMRNQRWSHRTMRAVCTRRQKLPRRQRQPRRWRRLHPARARWDLHPREKAKVAPHLHQVQRLLQDHQHQHRRKRPQHQVNPAHHHQKAKALLPKARPRRDLQQRPRLVLVPSLLLQLCCHLEENYIGSPLRSVISKIRFGKKSMLKMDYQSLQQPGQHRMLPLCHEAVCGLRYWNDYLRMG